MQEVLGLGKTIKSVIFISFVGICVNPFKEAIPLSPSPSPISLPHMCMIPYLELNCLGFIFWVVFFVHQMDTACSQFAGFLLLICANSLDFLDGNLLYVQASLQTARDH